MTTWLLIVTIFSTTSQAPDSHYVVRFHSERSCQKEADKINRIDEYEWYRTKHRLMEVSEEAHCAEDK